MSEQAVVTFRGKRVKLEPGMRVLKWGVTPLTITRLLPTPGMAAHGFPVMVEVQNPARPVGDDDDGREVLTPEEVNYVLEPGESAEIILLTAAEAREGPGPGWRLEVLKEFYQPGGYVVRLLPEMAADAPTILERREP